MIPFGPWTPDLPDLGNSCLVADNVRPDRNSYRQMPSLAVVSDALTARCQGAVSATKSDGNTFSYAGDATKLYRLATATQTDASRLAGGAYAISSDDQWQFAKWNDQILATNIADAVQEITMGNANFAALITSTDKPTAKYIAVVREFVVLGHWALSGSVHTEGVRWGGINSAVDFDGAPRVTQSDNQDLKEKGGFVQAIIGGEYGRVYRENAIHRMTYRGPPLIFQFDQVARGVGLWAPYSIASFQHVDWFISEDGFYSFDGVASTPIGRGRVDRTFFNEVDATQKGKIRAALDSVNKVVAWAYPTADSIGSGVPDKIMLYDWGDDRFSRIDVDVQMLTEFLSSGVTLEGLDSFNSSIDALSPSLDSELWKGGELSFGAYDPDNKLASFSGAAMIAKLITGEQQLSPGQRSFIPNVRPIVDGPNTTTTIAIGSRRRQVDTESFGSEISLNDNGDCPAEDDNVYHRFRATISGGFDHALGVEVEAQPSGHP